MRTSPSKDSRAIGPHNTARTNAWARDLRFAVENTNLIGFQDHPLGHTRLVTEEGSTECIL